MRKLALLLLTLAMAAPACAATGVSIAQFDQLLATAKGRSDAKTAEMLSGLELTERVSSTKLASWEAEFPGRRTRQVLFALADESAFLDSPGHDALATPAPDRRTQQQILARAVDYVSKTMAQLPNFYATRKTVAFEGAPAHPVSVERLTNPLYSSVLSSPGHGAIESDSQPLHVLDSSSLVITYRNGYEVVAQPRGRRKRRQPYAGLTTQGEFGPILTTVMGDAAHGSVVWSRWEQGVTGPLAVFHYAVPQERSSWMVSLPHGDQTANLFPGYHGEISIDPSNGAILRLTEIADFPPPYQTIEAAILVKYGSVVLGDRHYICPVKGIAISKVPILENGATHTASLPVQTQLNDVSFTQYHLFRADLRILPSNSSSSPASVHPPVR